MGFLNRKIGRRGFLKGAVVTAASAIILPHTLAENVAAVEDEPRIYSLDPGGKITGPGDWKYQNFANSPTFRGDFGYTHPRNYPQRFTAEPFKMDAAFAHAIWNSGEQFVLANPVSFGVGDVVAINGMGKRNEKYIVTKVDGNDMFWCMAAPIMQTRGEIKAATMGDYGYARR